MPTPRPLTPKRPKLSLQTSAATIPPISSRAWTASSNAPSIVESPTSFRKDLADISEVAPSTPVSARPRTEEAFAQLRQPDRPSPQHSLSSSSISTISTVSSGPSSPFPNTAPYTLSMGARSILRNSPLPRRPILHVSNRPPKRMFQPIRRVTFHENMIEWIPTPIISEAEASTEDNVDDIMASSETTASPTAEASSRTKSILSSPIKGRRKRRGRDWIWRPMDDESSPVYGVNQHLPATASSAPAVQGLTEEPRPLAILTDSKYQGSGVQ
ncbi:MAG: hypothetical protein Q9218_005338 [Villophora microphyllina]